MGSLGTFQGLTPQVGTYMSIKLFAITWRVLPGKNTGRPLSFGGMSSTNSEGILLVGQRGRGDVRVLILGRSMPPWACVCRGALEVLYPRGRGARDGRGWGGGVSPPPPGRSLRLALTFRGEFHLSLLHRCPVFLLLKETSV